MYLQIFEKKTMLAGPPPSFTAGSLPSIVQPSSQSVSATFPNKFQPPVMPPNFSGNSQHQPPTQWSRQPPILPPSHSNNRSSPLHVSPNNLSNGTGSDYPSYPQPGMITNGMSMLDTNLHGKQTVVHLFQINR